MHMIPIILPADWEELIQRLITASIVLWISARLSEWFGRVDAHRHSFVLDIICLEVCSVKCLMVAQIQDHAHFPSFHCLSSHQNVQSEWSFWGLFIIPIVNDFASKRSLHGQKPGRSYRLSKSIIVTPFLHTMWSACLQIRNIGWKEVHAMLDLYRQQQQCCFNMKYVQWAFLKCNKVRIAGCWWTVKRETKWRMSLLIPGASVAQKASRQILVALLSQRNLHWPLPRAFLAQSMQSHSNFPLSFQPMELHNLRKSRCLPRDKVWLGLVLSEDSIVPEGVI